MDKLKTTLAIYNTETKTPVVRKTGLGYLWYVEFGREAH